ncbi:hypothetical protein MYX78_02205 [Acidobacteria bacterium AH-259-G07]|nr:hypothetical protein [Acidobacteria bacterium AH-259-G07]
MRRLLYVPIIHMSADLGSVAPVAVRKGQAIFGEEFWEEHRETIEGFWKALRAFSKGVKAEGLKIYQDGMLAHGEAGRKIVEEAVEKGSQNFRIVLDLMEGGAKLMLTEDYQLAKKERDLLVCLSKSSGLWRRIWAYIKYKFIKGRLLKKRDRFIAARIDKTLGEGEVGILFVGASHDVCSKLPEDVEVIAVKDPERILGYQKGILRAAISGKRSIEDLKQLSDYLKAPIEVSLDLCA